MIGDRLRRPLTSAVNTTPPLNMRENVHLLAPGPADPDATQQASSAERQGIGSPRERSLGERSLATRLHELTIVVPRAQPGVRQPVEIRLDELIMAGVAILLAVDLLFFPWFSIPSGPISTNFSASDFPYGGVAIAAVIAAVALVFHLGLERLTSWRPPALSGTPTVSRLVLALLAGVFVLVKFLLQIDFRFFGWGFYVGVVLTVALVYFAVQARRAPGMPLARPAGPPPPRPSAT